MTHRKPSFLYLFLVFALASAHHAHAAMTVKRTPLMTISEYLGTLDGIGETLLVSPDCQHIAIVVQRGSEMAWQIDGNATRYYSNLGPGQWSPDSAHFAYAIPDGGTWRMTVDGKAEEAFDSVGFPVWSPNGGKLAYVAQRKGNFLIVNERQKSQPFESVKHLQFNANGSRLAAIVRTGGKDALWINGQIKSRADEIRDFVWSQHGDHYAFAAKNSNGWSVFHDERSGAAVEEVQLLTLSPNGQHLAYVGTVSGGTVVQLNAPAASTKSSKTLLLIADEKTLEMQNNPGYSYTGIVYSPDSARLAWTAGYFSQVVMDEFSFLAQQNPQAQNASGMRVFVDGKAGPAFTNVSAPVWSADSSGVAYGAIQIRQSELLKYLVADGTPSGAYHDITQPIWNPANAALAYAAVPQDNQTKSIVIHNGQATAPYDTASDLTFSADGKYFSYLALDGKGVFAVINGEESPRFDGFLGDVKSRFDANGHLHAVALKGKQVLHVELIPNP